MVGACVFTASLAGGPARPAATDGARRRVLSLAASWRGGPAVERNTIVEITLDGGGPSDQPVTAGESLLAESEELSRLVAEGHEHGVLRHEVLAAALEELDITRETAAEVYAYFEEHGIELVDGGEPHAAELTD